MTDLDEIAARLGPSVERDAPLASLTTYGVGGPAGLLARIPDAEALHDLASALRTTGVVVPALVVGLGSNLLVADAGFPGLVVVLGDGFAQVAVEGTKVLAGGRAKLPVVARQSAAAGLTGFEWASGVPGSIGGAVRMNAGVHEADMAAVLTRVHLTDLWSGEDVVMERDELGLGYRSSTFPSSSVVVAAELDLQPGDPAAARAAIKEKTNWRRENQPGGRNAGSVFTNPPGGSAGRLIDEAGLKGLRIGTAEVSSKHANFIQVDEGGRAADVWALMDAVRRRVHQASGVTLEPENVFVGLDPLPDLGDGDEARP